MSIILKEWGERGQPSPPLFGAWFRAFNRTCGGKRQFGSSMMGQPYYVYTMIDLNYAVLTVNSFNKSTQLKVVFTAPLFSSHVEDDLFIYLFIHCITLTSVTPCHRSFQWFELIQSALWLKHAYPSPPQICWVVATSNWREDGQIICERSCQTD